MMINVKNLVKKYHQAAWRIQRQWLALILLGVALAALVAGIYLNVSARGTLAGRQVLLIKAEITDNELVNTDLAIQLAKANSTENMEAHALILGFHPATLEEITYVVVPGYMPPGPLDLSTRKNEPVVSNLRPEYTQTLFEWFADRIQSGHFSTGSQP